MVELLLKPCLLFMLSLSIRCIDRILSLFGDLNWSAGKEWGDDLLIALSELFVNSFEMWEIRDLSWRVQLLKEVVGVVSWVGDFINERFIYLLIKDWRSNWIHFKSIRFLRILGRCLVHGGLIFDFGTDQLRLLHHVRVKLDEVAVWAWHEERCWRILLVLPDWNNHLVLNVDRYVSDAINLFQLLVRFWGWCLNGNWFGQSRWICLTQVK